MTPLALRTARRRGGTFPDGEIARFIDGRFEVTACARGALVEATQTAFPSVTIEAFGADGRDVSHELFAARDGMRRARHEGIPLMMTTDPRIALGDCLFYRVQRGESGGV